MMKTDEESKMTFSSEDRAEMLLTISDLYKAATGVRPYRIDFAAMSDDELQAQWDELTTMVEYELGMEKIRDQLAIKRINTKIDELVLIGARDRATAFRWLVNSVDEEDVGFALYVLGLPCADEASVMSQLGL